MLSYGQNFSRNCQFFAITVIVSIISLLLADAYLSVDSVVMENSKARGLRDKYQTILRINVSIPLTINDSDNEVDIDSVSVANFNGSIAHNAFLGIVIECNFPKKDVLTYCTSNDLDEEHCDWLQSLLRKVFNEFKATEWNENDHEYCEKEVLVDRATIMWENKIIGQYPLFGERSKPYDAIWNPSIVSLPNGMVVMSHRLGIPGATYLGTHDAIGIVFWNSWIDFFDYLNGRKTQPSGGCVRHVLHLSDPDQNTEVEMTSIRNYIVGEDMRLLIVGDELIGVFNSARISFIDNNNTKHTDERKICYVKIVISERGAYTVDGIHVLHLANAQQKNWVPFNYNGKLMFSFSISPHIVVAAGAKKIRENSMVENAEVISTSSRILSRLIIDLDLNSSDKFCNYSIPEQIPEQQQFAQQFVWPFGDYIAGGTPAILLDDTSYIAIFHSLDHKYGYDHRNHSSDVIAKEARYYMGAYIFSREPPFHVTSISKNPIVPLGVYQGKKFEVWTVHLDFVVYPVGLVIESDTLYISCGYNDITGFVVSVLLADVLSDMIAFGS